MSSGTPGIQSLAASAANSESDAAAEAARLEAIRNKYNEKKWKLLATHSSKLSRIDNKDCNLQGKHSFTNDANIILELDGKRQLLTEYSEYRKNDKYQQMWMVDYTTAVPPQAKCFMRTDTYKADLLNNFIRHVDHGRIYSQRRFNILSDLKLINKSDYTATKINTLNDDFNYIYKKKPEILVPAVSSAVLSSGTNASTFTYSNPHAGRASEDNKSRLTPPVVRQPKSTVASILYRGRTGNSEAEAEAKGGSRKRHRKTRRSTKHRKTKRR